MLAFDLFSDSKKPLKSSGIKGFFTSRLVAEAGFEPLPPTIRACIRRDSPWAAFAGRSSGGCHSQVQIRPVLLIFAPTHAVAI